MLSPDLSLMEIEIFVNVARLKSLKETSRRLGLRPSSLSKLITKLERKAELKLFNRSVYGMELTPEGARFYRASLKLMEVLPELAVPRLKRSAQATRVRSVVSVGAISFLSTQLLGPVLGKLARAKPDIRESTRFRLVEFNHTELVPYGIRGAIDVAVHVEPLAWTSAWHTTLVGKLRWGLFGRYRHPLGALCTRSQALRFPFIVPTGWSDAQGYVAGEDYCPVPVRARLSGHEASTAETAMELIQSTDDLSFLPELIARRGASRRMIQEIRVRDWPEVRKEIYLSVRSDKVPNRLFEALRGELKRQLG